MTDSSRSTLFCVICAFLFAFGIGILTLTLRPTDAIIQPPPMTGCKCQKADRDLVLGLAEIVVGVNKDATAARAECQAVKVEARQIINAMIQEIQRLQGRPTIKPDGHTAGPTLNKPTRGV